MKLSFSQYQLEKLNYEIAKDHKSNDKIELISGFLLI